MANYAKLKSEVMSDPLNLGYAGMTDKEILASLEGKTRTSYIDVPLSELAGLVELTGIYELLAGNVGNANAAKLLRIVRNETAITELGYSDPVKRQMIDVMIDDLVSSGVISAAQAQALRGLGTIVVSRASELGLGSLVERDIYKARN